MNSRYIGEQISQKMSNLLWIQFSKYMNQFVQQKTYGGRATLQNVSQTNRAGISFFAYYKKMRPTWANAAFFAALVIYSLARCISLSRLRDFDGVSVFVHVLVTIAVVILLCKITLLTVHKPAKVMVFAAVILTALLSCLMAGLNILTDISTLFILALFLVAAKDINVRMICLIVIYVVGFCMATIIVLSLVGVLENETLAGVDRVLGIDIARRRFGFGHQNSIGQLSLVIFLCYLYLRYKKFGVLDVAGCLVGVILLYFVVSTKTVAFIIAIGVVLVLVSKVIGWKRTLILCVVLGCLSVFAGLYLAWIYDPNNGFLKSLDSLLSGRLSYAHSFVSEYPVLPFGQELELISTNQARDLNVEPRVLDNAYINLLLQYGFVSLVLVMAAYGLAFVQAVRKRSVALLIMLALMLMVGNSETWLSGFDGMVLLCIAFGAQSSSRHNIETYSVNPESKNITKTKCKQTVQRVSTCKLPEHNIEQYPRNQKVSCSMVGNTEHRMSAYYSL